jgi:hypothetical protein
VTWGITPISFQRAENAKRNSIKRRFATTTRCVTLTPVTFSYEN